MFNSKYPIIALGMNQVSDLNLALAVVESGAIPTITAFNYANKDYILNINNLKNDFKIYQNKINICNFIFSIDDNLLLKNKTVLFEIFLDFKIQFIEIILNTDFLKMNYVELKKIFDELKKYNVKLLTKLISLENISNKFIEFINNTFQGIIIKGPDGAGRIYENPNKSLKDILNQCIEMFPKKFIIPCGGISSSTEIKELLDLGAGAVGIGTLFAASEESSMSVTAKHKIINSTSSNLEKLETYNFNQNALIFSNIEQSKINNTQGLVEGVTTGKTGHIFVGKSIDKITEIKSVKEIIKDLCKLL
jgi:NAD(P)H-dependent flavin oxidoreductase YrpB (nitropropane dioxygenase family)